MSTTSLVLSFLIAISTVWTIPSTAVASTCIRTDSGSISDPEFAVETWEKAYFQDALQSGVQGNLIVIPQGARTGLTDIYLEIQSLPEDINPHSTWIFLRQEETLAALRSRFLNQNRPILLHLPRVRNGMTYVAAVERDIHPKWPEYWSCLNRKSPLSLIVTPGMDHWALIHEEKHYIDVELGLAGILESRLKEATRLSSPGQDFSTEVSAISAFVLEQRAYDYVLRAIESGSGPRIEYYLAFQTLFRENESPFRYGSIETLSKERSTNYHKALATETLQFYGWHLSLILDRIQNSAPKVYLKLLQVIRESVARSEEYAVDQILPDHFGE